MEKRNEYWKSTYNPDGMIAIYDESKNGEILGMSSRPSFDPSRFSSVSPEVYRMKFAEYGVRMSLVQHSRLLR